MAKKAKTKEFRLSSTNDPTDAQLNAVMRTANQIAQKRAKTAAKEFNLAHAKAVTVAVKLSKKLAKIYG